MHVPCNDNLFEANDGSYSPNIAFEATFSAGNRFVGNRAYGCNYGFWLGFSRDTVLEQNTIAACRKAGVAVENGIEMVVHANQFAANHYGMLLWSHYVAAFAGAVPENNTSHSWAIAHNSFSANDIAIRIAADQDHGVQPLPALTPSCPRPHSHTIADNRFRRNHLDIEIIDADEPLVERNEFED
ncbi:MAG: hypothetical protein HC822_00140 [Oscillochloris sp.]|nr:hypothetical protein [Oscillochloris sp.]